MYSSMFIGMRPDSTVQEVTVVSGNGGTDKHLRLVIGNAAGSRQSVTIYGTPEQIDELLSKLKEAIV